MDSFHGIGKTGSASLAVVAPGISEALVATAIGLVAAIPAVVAYNHFVNKVNVLTGEMDNFSGEFLNIVERMGRRVSGGRSAGKPGRSTLSQINVTPFVDVMLVLLIIFMVTAPMMGRGSTSICPRWRTPPTLPPPRNR